MVNRGDIIFINFDPQTGSEQAGLCPALVISTVQYHKTTRTRALVCPITRTNRNLPVHIALDDRTLTYGYVMCDQLKTVDLEARNYRFVEVAPVDIVEDVVDVVADLIGA